ncbi:MAG: oligopeptidase A [Gammaproteobacteria bacterium RIFCSPHIGHO2_12_FULL_41_20]|nr:MAG: oligopeptidase A [Gammaproteobacteria bacterium RIFCSPHIGHO2_12_FULL_41_20]
MNDTTTMLKELPTFSAIQPERIEPTIKQILQHNRQKLAKLLVQENFTWNNLLQPLEDMEDELSKTWSPISHLYSVMESETLRAAYHATLPLITEYHTALLQDEHLFMAIESIAKGLDCNTLHDAQRKIIENEIRDFKLIGIHLVPEKKKLMAELQKQLSLASTKFSDNILDATNGWIFAVPKEKGQAILKGLPEPMLQAAEENAKARGLTGWVITLEYPSYSTAMKFVDNPDTRRQLYEAYVTRASDLGPNAGRWDNSPLMEEILKIRHNIAQLVGFHNYAEYSLATKMAKTPQEVLTFLQNLLEKSKPFAAAEITELAKFAKSHDGCKKLQAWDSAYYSEKLQQSKFHFTQEELRPYFPLKRVLSGLFTIVNHLYGLEIREEKDVNTWHPQVQFFSIYDEQGKLRGGLYMDLYARPHKRDGAWMDDCRTRRVINGHIQYPVAFLTCNFMRPLADKPALLTHDDVLTLFHEFGHCLHHLLTQVDYASVSGIHGVLWDAVEFPSQFMEQWCWEKETLPLISGHYQTGNPLPETLFKNLLAAKHFQAGMQMLRQLEFALFDFRLHLQDITHAGQILTTLEEVRKQTALIETPTFYRFPHSFSHIFSGGYAAGYYSYKWAEILSCDAFGQFEENGILDKATGRAFLKHILEAGGVPDPLAAFTAFRGRKPQIDALLKHCGLAEHSNSH